MVLTHINVPVLHKYMPSSVLTPVHYMGTFAESDQLFVGARFWCPGFQELAWHAQLLREPVPEKNTRAELPLRPRRRMSQPEPRRAFPMSAGWDLAFSRPVTGDYPAVVWKCCPDRSRMLFYQRNDSDPELCRRLRKCHSKNSVNLSLAPTQLVQVRSMRASEHSCHSPNSHSDTHRQACMAPIDRLMVGGGGGGRRATRHSWKQAKFNTVDTLSSPQS